MQQQQQHFVVCGVLPQAQTLFGNPVTTPSPPPPPFFLQHPAIATTTTPAAVVAAAPFGLVVSPSTVIASTTTTTPPPPHPSATPLPSCIVPRFTRLRVLGEGAFGTAWLCRDGLSGDLVVVKSLHRPSNNNTNTSNSGNAVPDPAAAAAQSEVKCLADSCHPNIVRFYDSVRCDDGVLYIIMEYADGGDLRRIVRQRSATSAYFLETEVMFIFLQIALALSHVHKKSILHRDVKTANILLMASGLIKLADFGFSRKYENEESVSGAIAQTFCGTPYYLAPELWTNRKYGNKAEVWSLGVILYELLALERPFLGGTIQQLAAMIVSGNYRPVPAMYSSQMHQLVATLLEVDPMRRPTTEQIFWIPYVQTQLASLRSVMAQNTAIPADIRSSWDAHAKAVLEAAAQQPPFDMKQPFGIRAQQQQQAAPAATTAEGGGCFSSTVRRMVTNGTTTSWTEHHLVLEGKKLVLVDAAEETPAELGKGRREIPISLLQAVAPIALESSKQVPNVFAIRTYDGKCTWFQTLCEETRLTWVNHLRLLIQAAHHEKLQLQQQQQQQAQQQPVNA